MLLLLTPLLRRLLRLLLLQTQPLLRPGRFEELYREVSLRRAAPPPSPAADAAAAAAHAEAELKLMEQATPAPPPHTHTTTVAAATITTTITTHARTDGARR